MENWKSLSETIEKTTWDFIYRELNFNPSQKNEKIIALPAQSECFDISKFYDEGFNEEYYDNLHLSAIEWFKYISKGNRIYALNWQHDSFSFNPYLRFEKDEFDEWLIPVFPNGDYLFFLSNDFTNGIFADGINLRISFWGYGIINALKQTKSKMLVNNINC